MGAGRSRASFRETVALPAAVGTISLRPVTVALEPAASGAGLAVRRTDTGQQWAIGLDSLVAATNCTAIGDADGSVAFLEHLLACLWAGGISDALITTDGPEIPLYDGSAATLWEAVRAAGRCESTDPWEPLVVTEPCHLLLGDQALLALPATASCFHYVLEHPHPLIGRQVARFCSGGDFGAEVAGARTFATVAQLRATRGREPGPEVEALCLVVYDDHLSAAPTLPEAFARHKLLDLLGDLFLCGRPLQGAVLAVKTGHGDNHAFLRRLLEEQIAPAGLS